MTTDSRTTEPVDEDRNPLDLLLDLSVYAPLGFALEFRRLVPELAEAGRRQIAFSRSLGKAALRTMAKAAEAPAARSRQPRAPDPAPAPTEQSGDELAVSGYDQLNARDAIAAVRRATPEQLTWIERRERATKERTTVLAAVEKARHGVG